MLVVTYISNYYCNKQDQKLEYQKLDFLIRSTCLYSQFYLAHCVQRGTHLIDTKAPKLMMLKLITIIIAPRDTCSGGFFKEKPKIPSLFSK